MMRVYYSPPFFFLVTVGNELFLTLLYLCGKEPSLSEEPAVKMVFTPLFLCALWKLLVNISQLLIAMVKILKVDHGLKEKEALKKK